MGIAIFIGDELSAAGFRLTGIETMVPKAGAADAALRDAGPRAALVIMTAETAQNLPEAELAAAMAADAPVLAIVPDVRLRAPAPDLAKRLRGILGIES
jgi:vacuolar-type H+-ATPase subunit F/Vma7